MAPVRSSPLSIGDMENDVDIEKVYEEMILYYRELESRHPVTTTKPRPVSINAANYANTARVPNKPSGAPDKVVRTRSASILRFTALYEK